MSTPRGPFSFEEAILRELDQMRRDRAEDRTEDAVARRELRDTITGAVKHFEAKTDDIADEVSDVKISVAELRRNPPRPSRRAGLARDAGCTVSGATLGALIAALVQGLTAPVPRLNPPQPAPISAPSAATR